MARLDPNAPIGWIGDDGETTDPKDAVKKLLLIFVAVCAGLMDSKDWPLLERLLKLMQNNVDATRELATAIQAGASIDDVRELLERRR